MSNLDSPPPHATSTESVTMFDTFDDIGSLRRFVESQIAKAANSLELKFMLHFTLLVDLLVTKN